MGASVEYDKDGKEIARWVWCSGEGSRQWLKKVAEGVYACPECGTIKNIVVVSSVQLG
jgi:hypothetical protein